jgi:predicted Zn-dependent protease
LTHAPEESQVRKNLAAVYVDLAAEAYRKGEYDACRNYLGLARQHDTENPAVYVLSGELAYQFGRYETAQQDWERALALDPDADAVGRRLAKLAQDRQRERGLSVQDTGIFRIHFERGEAAQLATEISDILRQAYRDVGQAFDVFPRSVVPVIVYPSQG